MQLNHVAFFYRQYFLVCQIISCLFYYKVRRDCYLTVINWAECAKIFYLINGSFYLLVPAFDMCKVESQMILMKKTEMLHILLKEKMLKYSLLRKTTKRTHFYVHYSCFYHLVSIMIIDIYNINHTMPMYPR